MNIHTTPSEPNSNDAEDREMRQLAREQRQAVRRRQQQAAETKAAEDRAKKVKDQPRHQWNTPERVRGDEGGAEVDGTRYCAPPPPRSAGTWVRVGHMWLRIVTVSGRGR